MPPDQRNERLQSADLSAGHEEPACCCSVAATTRPRAYGTGRTPLSRRLSNLLARLNSATPAATAALVLVVGAGLAVRAAASVL